MNYLKTFTNFFASQNNDLQQFEEQLKQDLLKTKADFEKDRLVFDIEPIEITEQRKDNDQYYAYHYKGNFIYGFQKDKIFHLIPGDLSSKTARIQNESGEIIFLVNKESNKVECISESFAGNSWGKKEKKKGFWGFLGIS